MTYLIKRCDIPILELPMLSFSVCILLFFSGVNREVLTISINFLLRGSRPHLIKCKVINEMVPKCIMF